MNLYLLERKDQDAIGWDHQVACVVAESSPRAARKTAQKEAGDEKCDCPDFWLRTNKVTCSVLAKNVKRESGLVLSSHSGA